MSVFITKLKKAAQILSYLKKTNVICYNEVIFQNALRKIEVTLEKSDALRYNEVTFQKTDAL